MKKESKQAKEQELIEDLIKKIVTLKRAVALKKKMQTSRQQIAKRRR